MKKQSVFAVLMAFSLFVGVQTFKNPVQANIGYSINEHFGTTGTAVGVSIQGGSTAGMAYLGAKAGAEIGGLLGTAFCPGFGTFVGGFAGAVIGAGIGAY